MKREEKIVNHYLESCGFKKIKYEPDGKVPPDFVINDKIAIEVRRLNENYFKDGRIIGHQEESIRLWDFLTNFLDEYRNENLRMSYWLSIEFGRPIPKLSVFKKLLKIKLDDYFNNTEKEEIIEITPTVKFHIYPKKEEINPNIHLVASLDENSGGAVLKISLSNINHCIQEKTDKIEEFRKNYSEWWLILVDKLIYGLSKSSETDIIKEQIILPEVWKKLIIITPELKEPVITKLN